MKTLFILHLKVVKTQYLIAFILALLSVLNAFSQAPTIQYFSLNNSVVKPYEKLEITIGLSRETLKYYYYKNIGDATLSDINKYRFPHDSTTIYMYADIISPTNAMYRVYGYYHQNYYFLNDNCNELIKLKNIPGKGGEADTLMTYLPLESIYPTPNTPTMPTDGWKFRFTPDTITGVWQIHIFITDKYSVVGGVRQWTTLDTSFNVDGPPANDGFLRLKEGRKRYIYHERTGNMNYDVPGPLSATSINKEYSCSFLGFISDLKDHNINRIRVWIDGNVPWEWYTPIKLIGYDPQTDAIYSRIFNQMNCARLDTLFEVCYNAGINIELTLFNPPLGTEDNGDGNNKYPMYDYSAAYNYPNPYTGNNYNHINIGDMHSPKDFYTRINNMQRNMVKYAISRWGYATNLFAWEIGNELLVVTDTLKIKEGSIIKYYPTTNKLYNDDTVRTWMQAMFNLIKYYDPHKHIVTSSVRSVPASLSNYSTLKINAQSSLPIEQQDWYEYSGGDSKIRDIMDVTVPHRYIMCPTCPDSIFHPSQIYQGTYGRLEELLYNRIVKWGITNNDDFSKLYKKPLFVDETGFDQSCNEDLNIQIRDSGLYLWDPYGVQVHNDNWCLLFSQSAGLPLHFNGTGYGEKYFNWKAPGEFWKNFNDIPDDAESRLIHDGRLRYSLLYWPDKSVYTGWVQDTTFVFPVLFRQHNNYLKSFNPKYKPSIIDNVKIFKCDSFSTLGVFYLDFINTLTGEISLKDTILTTPNSLGQNVLQFKCPSFWSKSLYGDFSFRAIKTCDPHIDFHINTKSVNDSFIMYSDDTLFVQCGSGGYNILDSIVYYEVDSNNITIPGLKKTETFSLSSTNYFIKSYSGTDLPLWCEGATFEGSNPKLRRFKAVFYTTNCFGGLITSEIKYAIVPQPLSVHLSIDNTTGFSIDNPLSLSFGQDLILNSTATIGANYGYYYLEETDSTNSIGNLVITGGPNPIVSECSLIRLFDDEIISKPNGSPNFLMPCSTSNCYYRIILSAGRYLGCGSVPGFYSSIKNDTAYARVKNCHASAYYTLDGDTNFSSTDPYDFFEMDSVYAVPHLDGATQVYYVLQRLDNFGTPIGPAPRVGYGYSGSNFKHLIGDHLLWLKNQDRDLHNDTTWFDSETILKLTMEYNNTNVGGCESTKYWSKYIRINHCFGTPDFKLQYKENTYLVDTITVQQGDSVFINLQTTRGFDKFDYELYRKIISDSSYIFIGDAYNNSWIPVTSANIIGHSSIFYFTFNDPYFTAIGSDTALYMLKLTGFRSSNSSCSTTNKYLYIKVIPPISRVVKIKDTTWANNQLFHFCDTTTYLPININPNNDIIQFNYVIEEMEPTVVGNTFKVKVRYNPVVKSQYVHVPDYGYYTHAWHGSLSRPELIHSEANNLSISARMYPLNRDRIWRIRGDFKSFNDTISFSFLFDFQDCPTPPPLFESNDLIEDSNSQDSILLNPENANCIGYPNPIDNFIQIECTSGIKILSIFDINGRKVDIVPTKTKKLYAIDFSNIKSGIYYIQIVLNENVKTLKVIKI